jgi:hypothetical protein
VRRRLESLRTTEFCADILQPELSNHLTLEVMPPFAGFYQRYSTIRAQNGNWKTRKTRSGANICQGIDLWQLFGESGGIQNQPPDDFGGRPVASQIDPFRPLSEQQGEFEQCRELIFVNGQLELGEPLGQEATGGGIIPDHHLLNSRSGDCSTWNSRGCVPRGTFET